VGCAEKWEVLLDSAMSKDRLVDEFTERVFLR
jgi:hypothetical protein